MSFCLDVVEAWEDGWGPGVERNEDMGYVGVHELSWRWATGDGGFMRALWMWKTCCAPSPDRHLVPHVMGTP